MQENLEDRSIHINELEGESVDSNGKKNEIVGPFAEYPISPPIGGLQLEDLGKREWDDKKAIGYLYELLEKRYGLTADVIFNRIPEGHVWNERTMLEVVALSLEGFSDFQIAVMISDHVAGGMYQDKEMDPNSIQQRKVRFVTDTVKEQIKINKNISSRVHAILFPKNQRTEAQIKDLEKEFKLLRKNIFNIEEPGMLPGPHAQGLYDTEIAVRILHDRFIKKMNTEDIAVGLTDGFDNRGKNLQASKVGITQLISRLLSSKAKKKELAALRVAKG